MKKLLLSLVVLATIFSCGKNNSVSSGSTSSSSSELNISVSGTVESNLASQINNNSFGSGYASVYTTWAQLISNQPNLTYYFYRSSISSSSSSCSIKWKIFYVCSGGNNSTGNVSRVVINSTVDLASKKAELISIINKRSAIQQSGTVYYITTTDAKYYIIDTAKPLQVNPVSAQDSSGNIEYFGYAM